MDTKQIKETLQSKEYDFLREDKHLGDNIILLTTGGSHAYGTNIETSDLDIRGIAIENIENIIGLGCFEQFINTETDTTIYGLRKVIGLMLNCNPNIIEMFGTKKEHIFTCNKYGQILKDNLDLFLSKKAIYSFGGYATAQLRRLENALAGDDYPQSEKEKHILNSIQEKMKFIEDRYKKLTNEELKLYIDSSSKEGYDSEIFMDCKLNHYPLRDFKALQAEMHSVVKNYDTLNHRNSKKDEMHLLKHSMHLIRLLKMGTEILEGKGVNTNREGIDLNLLMDIRTGKYSYDEIFALVNKYEEEFKYASSNTSLPDNPCYKKVEEILIYIYKDAIKNIKR